LAAATLALAIPAHADDISVDTSTRSPSVGVHEHAHERVTVGMDETYAPLQGLSAEEAPDRIRASSVCRPHGRPSGARPQDVIIFQQTPSPTPR